MHVRNGEDPKGWFRASRFFNVGDAYFFSTREGKDIGPFPTLRAAERGLSLYLQVLIKQQSSGIYASKIAMQGVWATTDYY